MSTVIKVENISKIYRLGQIGSGTLSDDLVHFWARVRGKENPLKKVNEGGQDDSLHVALRDVSFDVHDGDVLGIVGKNGAGKSTLLKILARITSPTTGTVKMKGRVASLLEVGTGFHPDLSGRENIYLNGAILGMLRSEVSRKFDEIVDFSGVAKFIDTPVKRYSSGMYVRLAFAVAAHLEPEILIVDEVLAVGDAEFQKKCLGKMKDVSAKQGRTVLFVSHNMTAVKNLCTSAIYLKNGTLNYSGTANDVVNHYLKNELNNVVEQYWEPGNAPGNDLIKVKSIRVVPQVNNDEGKITPSMPLNIEFEFWNFVPEAHINLSMHVYNVSGEDVFNSISPIVQLSQGLHKGVCHIPADYLNNIYYSISMMVVKDGVSQMFFLEHALTFEVAENREGTAWHGKWPGFVRPKFNFSLE